MSLPPNTRLGRYEIRAQIGAGGMGEVYLAEDTKLDRRVALKILPPEFAEDKDRMSRFVREAKSASALNHPNIITIHEIGESEGTHFIATEFIDGETLNEYAKTNRPDYKAVLELAVQIASALTEAHAAGIVHRDIKPDNIMVRASGLVKILDFGIAKLATPTEVGEEATTAIKAQTQAGMIIGTPQFMSPEQARGQGVDHQTDIFSFGVVLYEMLSGASPFVGETVSDVLAAVLMREPERLRGVPVELEEIVYKALQKDKRDRYQTAQELLRDLKEVKQELEFQEKLERSVAPNRAEAETQIIKAPATAEENQETNPRSASRNSKSIVVLPFTNMSADGDNEYFCDGLAEELLNALSKIEDLKVAARTSAFSFKGKNANVSDIGETLSVGNVLEGSVRKSGNKLRISVQLVNAADGYQLWSERYDRELKDIFEVQDEITLAVVNALKLKLLGAAKEAVLKRHTRNAEAHEHYLRGLFYFNRFTPADFQKAIENFKRAIAVDKRYAAAFAGLANAYVELAFFTFSAPGELMAKAREAVKAALALDDALGEAPNSLAIIKMYYERDYPGAEREFKRALALDAGNANINMWYAWYLGLMGRFEESFQAYQRARELDPLSEMINTSIGIVSYWAGQSERALRQLQKVLELNPNYSLAQSFLAEVYAQRGDFAAAAALAAKLRQSASDPLTLPAVGYVYAKTGDHHKAREILTALAQRAKNEFVSAVNFAQIYAGLSDAEQTLAWLEKACGEQWLWITFVKVDPKFDFLRSNPRFQNLLQRMGFPIIEKHPTGEPRKELAASASKSEQPNNRNSETQNPKSKWRLFGLLGLIVLVVGVFFGYKYFAPTNKQINSIAVLPFENKSSDADTDYLSDGLAESLIYRLSQLPDLKVSPTSSVFRYKGKASDPQTVAKELGVDSVMTGRITQRGDDLTVSVNLVDTRNGKSLWGEQYKRKLSDLLATQREIATEITNKLQLKLSGEGEQKLAKKYTDNNDAYQLYMKGNFYASQYTKESLAKGSEYYNQAIAIDPNYALAYNGLAYYYIVADDFYLSPSDSMPKARAAAQRALEIDETLADPHTSLAVVLHWYDWDWAAAEKEFRRAIELNPNDPRTRQDYSWFLVQVGRTEEAIAEGKKAQQLDPLSPEVGIFLGQVYNFARRNEEAIEQLRKTVELDQNYWVAHDDLGRAYEQKGDLNQALTEYQRARQLEKNVPEVLALVGRAYALMGKKAEAQKVIDELKELSKRIYVPPYNLAIIYVGLGNKDEAFTYLNRAYDERSYYLTWLKVDSQLDNLRADPRFKDLLKRVNLPE